MSGLVALKCSHIQDVEVHRVLPTMISASNGHINLMDLRARAGAKPCHVAWLLANIADAGKRTAATTPMGTPTATTSDAAASVVDLLGGIAAPVVECGRTTAVAKTRWPLGTLEKLLPLCGCSVAAISKLMAKATCSTLVLPGIVATSRGAGVVDFVAVAAGVAREVSPPAIDHNGLKACGHLHCAAFGFLQPLFLLGIPKVRNDVINGSLAPPP